MQGWAAKALLSEEVKAWLGEEDVLGELHHGLLARRHGVSVKARRHDALRPM